MSSYVITQRETTFTLFWVRSTVLGCQIHVNRTLALLSFSLATFFISGYGSRYRILVLSISDPCSMVDHGFIQKYFSWVRSGSFGFILSLEKLPCYMSLYWRGYCNSLFAVYLFFSGSFSTWQDIVYINQALTSKGFHVTYYISSHVSTRRLPVRTNIILPDIR